MIILVYITIRLTIIDASTNIRYCFQSDTYLRSSKFLTVVGSEMCTYVHARFASCKSIFPTI